MNPSQHPTQRGVDETARLLSEGLSRLREPRPEFQAELEARLLARLPEASRPWWRLSALGPSRRVNHRGTVIPRRRAILGMAAAAAGVLALASVTIPYSQTQSVSAEEILQKAQALSENPLAAKVKSFHLTARSTGRLGPNGDKPLDLTTEQWFAAPDRMRTETKSKATDGRTVISGFVGDGQDFKHYETPGAGERDVVAVIGFPGMKAVAVDKSAVDAPGPGAEAPKAGVFISRKVQTNEKSGEGQTQEIKKIDVDKDQVIALKECKQSRKQEEATVAGRKAYVVETDFSTCEIEGDAANLPDKMPGRHVAWIDKETYVPLKMEDYARDGKLMHTYEVTSVEYDVTIADSTFKDIPPKGTELKDFPMTKLPESDDEPGVRRAPAPALSGTPIPAPTR